MIKFTLYSRLYCHLCDDMLQALEAFRARAVFEVEVLDIDRDDVLLGQYDELVPVLVGHQSGANGVQLCHYHLDLEKVSAFLAAQPGGAR
ncbi:glutaredoxin family protein [Herminiimonas sp. CN]|uniref:glutaredoxin family protein n=1 Tax=Herminiimonas sp. CN TaxID=1349818 RepID=UPI00047320E1|nr:glutaredoxin family protein [Herminiimonas sp. CN]